MQKSIIISLSISALILSSCSSENSSTFDATEESHEASSEAAYNAAEEISDAPDINITAAPGVAFNYRYKFRVPDAKIAGVQEEHAAACEALGVSRCRITGMRYRLYDEERVGASLEFKLDPAIAREFGKDAIASVEKAKGILVDSEISGIDAGAKIDASQKRVAGTNSDLKRIETELKARNLGDRERAQLQSQAQRLRQQLDSEASLQRANEESLATTPMTMSYNGGKNIPGFEHGNPFYNAWDNALSSFVFMTSLVLLAIGVMLPWLILSFLLLLIWRSPPMHRLRQKLSDMRTSPYSSDESLDDN